MSRFFLKALVGAAILASVTSAQAEKSAPAQLDSLIAPAAPNCEMIETAQVSLNFDNRTSGDLRQIKPDMDKKIEEVKTLAKEAGINNVDIQSMNYSIYNNNSGSGCGSEQNQNKSFQVSGSISFTVVPGEKATDLMAKLMDKGYNGSLNVNAYKQCK